MKDNTKTFFELLSKDEELRKKVCAMTERKDIIALAKELGVELTEADFETRDGEMSKEELNTVAGGACSCMSSGSGMGVVDDNPSTLIDRDIPLCFCSLCGWGDGEFI